MESRISANFKAIPNEKWGHAFIEYCLKDLSLRKGVSRQYLISRLIVYGLAFDPLYAKEFEALKKSWLDSRPEGDVSHVKSFVADIVGSF